MPPPASLHLTSALHTVAGPLLVSAIQETVSARGRCRLALSGGRTPAETLRWLAHHLPADLYPHLWVTWVDERAVPPSDPRANLRLAEEQWLAHTPHRPARLLPLSAPGPLSVARDICEMAFVEDFGGEVDVVLLGVGEDGHIASLFPGHAALGSARLVEAVADSPKPPAARLTLTLPVLQAAPRLVVLAQGAEKAAALARAWAGAAPLGHLPQARWVLDPAAAAQLPPAALAATAPTTEEKKECP